MGKMAVIVLRYIQGECNLAELLEQELQQILLHNGSITAKWSVEKVTILNDQ